jgi:hypothetical protein
MNILKIYKGIFIMLIKKIYRFILFTFIFLLNLNSFIYSENMVIGINLNGVSDWTSEWPFVDIMKISRWWITHNADGSGGWDTGYDSLIPIDINYYPLQIPFDPDGEGPIPPQIVRTVWDNNNLPTGTYTVICEGTGRIRFWGSGTGTINITNGGTYTVNIPNKGFLAMEIEQSQQGDHLRNIRLIMPGFASTYQTNPFHPLFLERISPFSVIRFMDWGATNNSNLINWSDRPKVNDYSYALKGVPYEIMIDLVNRLDASPWICVPHQATDDYIRQLIILLKNTYIPNKKIYLEYSNETWNWQFSQANYCEEQGQILGLPSFYGYRWAYHCKRACDIWRIFKQEFGSTEKLVKILATQVGWGSGTPQDPYPISFMLNTAMNDPKVNPDGEKADAIAIAPYFAPVGMSSLPETITVDEILNLCQQDINNMTSSGGMVPGHKNVANQYGAQLICYEGGQHMVRSDSTVLTDKFIQANRDQRIYDLYIDYLNKLNAAGVNLFCHFVDCGTWSKWGMWGAMEYQDQTISSAHKYRALIDWINLHITPTPNISVTVTRTSTFTYTVTNTPSRTTTATVTSTYTRTPTGTVSPTHTRTISPTHSISPTITQTWTGTPPSYTNTPTMTPSLTITMTFTWTETLIFTYTGTPTITLTYTCTETPTNTITLSRTVTPTLTVTDTISSNTPIITHTYTLTPSVTFSRTLDYTRTATTTNTGTKTATWIFTTTRTFIPTFTQTSISNQQSATKTPVISSQQFTISDVVIYPVPWITGDLKISFSTTQEINKIRIRIYTDGYRLVKQITFTEQVYSAGRNTLNIESKYFNNLANGIYFIIIYAQNLEGIEIKNRPEIFIVLK